MGAIEIAGAVVAGLSLLVAVWAAWAAHKSQEASERAAAAAERDATAAERSAAASELSVAAAQRSATAAEESATTAREALELQRREAEATQGERARRLLADIVPVRWESRNSQPHGGLIVTNRGPGVASDVRGECLVSQLYRVGETASLMPGATVGFRDELKDFHPTAEEVGELPEPRADGEYVARASWTNENGSAGASGWRRIPRF